MNLKQSLKLIWDALITPLIFGSGVKILQQPRYQIPARLAVGFWLIMMKPLLELVSAFLYSQLMKSGKSIETLQDVILPHQAFGTAFYFEAIQAEHLAAQVELNPKLRSVDALILEVLGMSKEFQDERGDTNSFETFISSLPRLIESGQLIFFSNSVNIELYRSAWAAYHLEIAPNRHIQTPVTLGYLGGRVAHKRDLRGIFRQWDEMGIVGRCRLGYTEIVRDLISSKYNADAQFSDKSYDSTKHSNGSPHSLNKLVSAFLSLASGLIAALLSLTNCESQWNVS